MDTKSNESLTSWLTKHVENIEEALIFEDSDLSASVELAKVPKTFTFGAEYSEKDWGDKSVVNNCDKSDEPTQATEFEPKSPRASELNEVIPPSPVISSSSRRGSVQLAVRK